MSGRRLLIYAMNHAPEVTGCGRYSGELAQAMAARGIAVEVVTTPPHYPGWFARAPYHALRYRRELSAGQEVWRCPVWLSRRASGLSRLLAPMSFALSSAPVAFVRILRWRPDAILCVEPTLAVTPVALLAGWLTRSRRVLHVQDLEVDAALAVGHLTLPSMLRRAAFAIERALLRRFGTVITISGRMVDRLAAKGVVRSRLVLVRNWVDTAHIRPLGRDSAYRRELGISDDTFVVLYSGQIGAKQSLHLLFDAADALRDDRSIVFVVAGEGPMKASFAERSAALPNVRLLPLQPEERLGEFLGLADCHLLPQDAAVADLVLPSKLGGMLASGRRILVTAEPDSEIATFLGATATLTAPGRVADAIAVMASAPGEHDPAAALALAQRIAIGPAMDALEAALFGVSHGGTAGVSSKGAT